MVYVSCMWVGVCGGGQCGCGCVFVCLTDTEGEEGECRLMSHRGYRATEETLHHPPYHQEGCWFCGRQNFNLQLPHNHCSWRVQLAGSRQNDGIGKPLLNFKSSTSHFPKSHRQHSTGSTATVCCSPRRCRAHPPLDPAKPSLHRSDPAKPGLIPLTSLFPQIQPSYPLRAHASIDIAS